MYNVLAMAYCSLNDDEGTIMDTKYCACGFRGSEAEIESHLYFMQDDKSQPHYVEEAR